MAFSKWLLLPLAWPYGLALRFRHWLYDRGVLPSHRFNVPVICVGNLELGGTGKSPLAAHLCRILLRQGERPALLSRGYGRIGKGFLLVDEKMPASQCGDEPLQAKRRHPQAIVAVCADRAEGIRRLLAMDTPPSAIILDDAFQHRGVSPSLSLLVTPSEKPFWRNALLPAGSLRDVPSNAKRADALVLSGEGKLQGCPFQGAVFHMTVCAKPPVPFHGPSVSLADGDGIMLLSGIARPERFERLASQSFRVLRHVALPDHHRFTSDDLRGVLSVFHSFGADARAVLCTEKDAMRLLGIPELDILSGIPLSYLPIEPEIGEGDTFERYILDHVRAHQGNG